MSAYLKQIESADGRAQPETMSAFFAQADNAAGRVRTDAAGEAPAEPADGRVLAELESERLLPSPREVGIEAGGPLRAFGRMLSQVWVLLEKELRSEWRTREILSAMGVFGALVLLVFNFAFPPGVRQIEALAPGILWVSFIFAGILGLNRSMAQEKEEGCLQGLLLSPVDRGVLYLGKMLANLLFLSLLELLVVLLFAVFFNVGFSHMLGSFALITFLGSVGFIAVGTLFAAIAVQTRFQEVLLPILLIPLVAPILIGAVKSTGAIMGGGSLSSVMFWVKFLLTFDAVFIVVCFLGFEYVVQE